MPKRDPRAALEKLSDEPLFRLARNPAATNRLVAVEILIQRCSAFIRRQEIADLVERYLADEPKIKQT